MPRLRSAARYQVEAFCDDRKLLGEKQVKQGMIEPKKLIFKPSGIAPNHPHFPVLVYSGVALEAAADTASAFEALFAENGWPAQWRNGVYSFHHYHSTAHEVLGIAQGSARLLIGGPDGEELKVGAGDALVLPAGTGHCCLSSTGDFLVVGGYPPGADADLHREKASAKILKNIERVPMPSSDPVVGKDAGITRLWSKG